MEKVQWNPPLNRADPPSILKVGNVCKRKSGYHEEDQPARFHRSAGLGAVSLNIPARSWAGIVGANGTVCVAVIGLNGRGRDHVRGLGNLPGVRIAALCDVDSKVPERKVNKLKGSGRHAGSPGRIDGCSIQGGPI